MLLILFLVALGHSPAHGSEPGGRERSFMRSLELFDSAKSPDDYRESAKVLESLLADGFRNGAVYFNLGNAYFRAGDYGRAIISYRKARPYRPRDSYLAANLEQALIAAPGRLPESPEPWWTHVIFWSDWISYPSKIKLVFVSLMVAAASLSLAILLQQPRWNLGTTCLILLSAILGIDAGIEHFEVDGSRRAVITGETIARKGTGVSYEAAFDQPLKDGAEFQVLSETPDWTFGHFGNVGDGWVRNEFIAR